MSAGDEMINAAHLIVKLCDEKIQLDREVANLKKRSDLIIEKGHNLIEERIVLRVEKENAERDVVRLKAELEAAQHEVERLKANDWGPLNLRVEQAERERNEFQGALLRVKFALGWASDATEMNETIIQLMVNNARYYLAEKNKLAFK